MPGWQLLRFVARAKPRLQTLETCWPTVSWIQTLEANPHQKAPVSMDRSLEEELWLLGLFIFFKLVYHVFIPSIISPCSASPF